MKPTILIEGLFKLRQRRHTNENYGSSWDGKEVLTFIGPWASIRHVLAFACALWKAMDQNTQVQRTLVNLHE